MEMESGTLEGSTFWKFLTQEMTRSATSDLSRKLPRTSSQKRRRRTVGARVKGELRGRASTRTLRYLMSGKVLLLAAMDLHLSNQPKPHSLPSSRLFDSPFFLFCYAWLWIIMPKTLLFHLLHFLGFTITASQLGPTPPRPFFFRKLLSEPCSLPPTLQSFLNTHFTLCDFYLG